MLLVLDGAAVFWRHHESVLDYRLGWLRPVGENYAVGSWIGRVVGLGVAAWGALVLATATLTIAAPTDYRFEAAEVKTSGPGKTTVAVRLVHVKDQKPVVGAVILESKTDMGPSGMGEMFGKVTAATSDQPGLYRFLIETGMAGKWELVLTAIVRGEARPVAGKIVYDAK